MVTVTAELLREGQARTGLWNKEQLMIFDAWNGSGQKKGWTLQAIGTRITEEQRTRFLALKGAHLNKKLRAASKTEPFQVETSVRRQGDSVPDHRVSDEHLVTLLTGALREFDRIGDPQLLNAKRWVELVIQELKC